MTFYVNKHIKHRSVQWTLKHRVNTGRLYTNQYVNETLQAQVIAMDP